MRDSLAKVNIDNIAALKKLSDLGELYIAVWNYSGSNPLDAYYERFLDPQKVVFCGKNKTFIGFRTIVSEDESHVYMFSYDVFSGEHPKLAFVVNKFWKEIFTDL